MDTPTIMNGDAASSSKIMSPSHQQAKSPHNKAGEHNNPRKSLGVAPDDGAQKRAAPKAWTTGMNPITQRTTTPTHANGAVPASKPSTTKSNVLESLSQEKLAADRVAHLLSSLLGLQMHLNTKNGDAFSGIFAGASLEGSDPSYLFKMVRQTSKPVSNGASSHDELEYVGVGPDHAMTFGTSEVTNLLAKNVPEVTTTLSQNGAASGFRTDSDIAGNMAIRERHLQKWVSPTQGGVDMSLEPAGDWDQFIANEQQFGVTSDYDENLYTTRIDRSNPLYPMRLAQADRIAREIEADSSTNVHMREERGRGDDDGADEEERYSGVRRNGPEYPPLQSSNPNRYMPPARRSANSKNITAGSSIDPAIISSQIARLSPKAQEAQAVSSENQSKLEPSSDASKTSELKLATQTKATKETPTRPILTIAPKPIAIGTTATKNVEANVRDAFHQFANEEKLKVQDSRRSRASADKAIKINDLVKFSKNFKLLTPIPKDLVPILAKDKSKQEDLVEKAARNAAEMASNTANTNSSAAGKAVLASGTEAKVSSKPLAATRWEHDPNHSLAKVHQQHQQQLSRSRQPLPLEQGLPSTQLSSDHARAGPGLLGHRLADGHRMHKMVNQANVPAPLPIQDARKRSSGGMTSTPSPQRLNNVRSPTSAKLNVNAATFKPNPAASAFKPIDPSVASSPQSGRTTQPVSRPPSPSEFFGNRKLVPLSERPSILDHFNPLKFLKAAAEKEGKAQEYSKNGGIKPAYKTPPTWNPPLENEEFKSYKDMFNTSPPINIPQHPSPNSQPLPHAHQLPPHLQGNSGIPQVQAHQVPPHMPLQIQHYNQQHPHDDHFHSMRPSASSSSVYPAASPRVQSMAMASAFPSSPMTQHAQLAYGQPVPSYYMSTNGHPTAFRPYPGGSPMVSHGAHLAAPVMMQQQPNGGIMGMPQPMGIALHPQLTMYPNGQAYPAPHQPPNGYPSPGRTVPMLHQGSHQGQHHPGYGPPNQYGQPIYAQQQPGHSVTPMRGYGSPQPPYAQTAFSHQYPHQPHRTPSSGYAQLPQVHHHHQHVGSQQGPPAPSMDLTDSAK